MSDPLSLRYEIQAADPENIRAVTESTGVFSPGEIEIAVELAQERLAKGEASGYYFIFAEGEGQVRGYACYGPIALTVGSYDLYWIAVAKSAQGSGLGRTLLEESEQADSRGGRTAGVHRDLDPAALCPHPRLLRALRLHAGSRACGLLRRGRRQGDLREGDLGG